MLLFFFFQINAYIYLFDFTMMKHIRDNAETSIRNAIY